MKYLKCKKCDLVFSSLLQNNLNQINEKLTNYYSKEYFGKFYKKILSIKKEMFSII